jgi:hypothetical protein
MNQDIINWAREAWDRDTDPWLTYEQVFLKRFAALVAAAERERVCRIVTGLCISDNNAREINEAIREQS